MNLVMITPIPIPIAEQISGDLRHERVNAQYR